ncbi:MAG: ABC transporter permease [Verrucomicrobiales bacterium]|nr:ABC transporter permease [Verrucomicrobiales bacterium]
MLRVLLAKDLRRAWRNPLPWLIFLAIPLVIVALIGSAFGSRATGDSGLGRIRFAVVDEDDSPLTGLLRGAASQAQAGKYLEPVFLERAVAERQVQDNQLSALLVIPRGFTRDYLTGNHPVKLELVKNPAQSLHPAVLEELLAVVVTGLDVLKRHLGPELAAWQAVFEGQGDYRRVAELIVRAGDQWTAAQSHLDPLRVTYAKEPREPATEETAPLPTASTGPPPFNLFGFLLPGLAAMFLLFLGNNAVSDLKREFQQGTLARTRTVRQRLFPFVAAKLVFSVVMLLICAGILLGGGGLLFGVAWRDPGAVAALSASYCVFAAGFMCFLGALVAGEERADAFANVIAMAVGLAGGGAFPAQQLPGFLRDYVTPWLPNHWFTKSLHDLLFSPAPVAWGGVAVGMLVLGAGLAGLAAWRLQRRLEKGQGA